MTEHERRLLISVAQALELFARKRTAVADPVRSHMQDCLDRCEVGHSLRYLQNEATSQGNYDESMELGREFMQAHPEALALLALAEPEPAMPAHAPAPSYHDLHITTAEIPRTSIMNLPFRVKVKCTRVGGWVAFARGERRHEEEILGGEYEGGGKWLILDVGGHVICNSRDRQKED